MCVCVCVSRSIDDIYEMMTLFFAYRNESKNELPLGLTRERNDELVCSLSSDWRRRLVAPDVAIPAEINAE